MDAIVSELSSISGFSIAARSEIGGRPSQQDCVLIHGENARLFVALCDGMGGTARGGVASLQTIEGLRHMISDDETYEMACNHPVEFLRYSLMRSDNIINSDVELHGSGTTLTSLLLDGRQAYWASVGDSRLYILRGNEMIQATRDHNYRMYLNELKAHGQISQKRYENEMARGNALISYIGIGKLRLIDLTQQPVLLYSGDLLLLTSDGLTGLLTDAEIQSVLQLPTSLDQRADQLMRIALYRSRTNQMDNTTFVLVQIM